MRHRPAPPAHIGCNVYDTVQFEHDNDEAAIRQVHRINVPAIGAGFEVWQGNRLVYQHRT
jgi:hypothetical protein